MFLCCATVFIFSICNFWWLGVVPVFFIFVSFLGSAVDEVDDYRKGFILLGILVFLLVNAVGTTLGRITMIGIIARFMMFNFFFFLVFFEFIMVPISLLIFCGVSSERFLSSISMLGYTLVFSIPLFVILVKMYMAGVDYFFGFLDMCAVSFETVVLVFCVFLVKFPIFLFHRWLPRAHVESSTMGSVILASCLLKAGSFGLGRFFGIVYSGFLDLVAVFSVAGFLVSGVFTVFCTDIKAFIAFSSIFHMRGLSGSLCGGSEFAVLAVVYVSCAHGFVSAGMFFFAGLLYDVYGTRCLLVLRGYSVSFFMFLVWVCFLLMNVGMPISIGFFSELFSFFQLVRFLVPWLLFLVVGLFFGGIYIVVLVYGSLGYRVPRSCSCVILFKHFMWFFVLVYCCVLFWCVLC